MSVSIILLIIALLVVLEGLFISVFPKKTKLIMKEMSKDLKKLRGYGLIELIIGIFLVLVSIGLRSS